MKFALPWMLLLPLCFAAPQHDPIVKDIRTLLDTYCARCHGASLQTAGINFARFSDTTSILHDLPLWRKVLAKVQANEMPPAAPLLTGEERDRLVRFIEGELRQPGWEKVRNAGEV